MLRSKPLFKKKHVTGCKTLAHVLLAEELNPESQQRTLPPTAPEETQSWVRRAINSHARLQRRRIGNRIKAQQEWYEEEVGKWGYLMLNSEIEQREKYIATLGTLAAKYLKKS